MIPQLIDALERIALLEARIAGLEEDNLTAVRLTTEGLESISSALIEIIKRVANLENVHGK